MCRQKSYFKASKHTFKTNENLKEKEEGTYKKNDCLLKDCRWLVATLTISTFSPVGKHLAR